MTPSRIAAPHLKVNLPNKLCVSNFPTLCNFAILSLVNVDHRQKAHPMTSYYVSAIHGDDLNPGTDPSRPFASLQCINRLSLRPSDTVLLERGSVFQGQYLHVHGSGAPGRPITIGAYGEGPMPAIHADGTGIWHEDYRAPIGGAPHRNSGDVSTTLLIKDVPYIEVRDLEITNIRINNADGMAYNDRDAMNRTGVAVIAENCGVITHTVIEGLYIHDIHGNVYDKHMANGGIYVIAHFPEDPTRIDTDIARFDDVHIRDNTVARTDRWGIAVGYTAYLNMIDHGERDANGDWANRFDYGDGTIDDEIIARYGATNVIVENNIVEDTGGDAITTMYCDRPIVRGNVSRRAARHICYDVYTATDDGRVAAAIWPWRCKNALFEYNRAYDTLNADNGNGDGQAWDADYGDGTIYRYNYSSGNSGGTVMICNEMAVNTEFHHNVAYHDRMGAIDIPRNPDAWIHDNMFVLADDCDPLRLDRADGAALVERNLFVSDTGRAKSTDWHPQGSQVTWRNNRYVNFTDIPGEEQ